jgi:hypothetical protein
MKEVLTYIFAGLFAVAMLGRLGIHVVRMFKTKDLQSPDNKR